ncbi:hypothetical protein BH09BAC6_BH09BAC6_24510 [soil metagenome]
MDSLSGTVRRELSIDPTGGEIFIFFNRKRNMVKLLHFEGDGFAIYHKRLEAGTYELPLATAQASSVQMSSEDLLLILSGISLKSIKRRKRFSLKKTG